MEMMLLSFLLPAAKDEFQLDSWLEASIGSVVFAGMMFGAYFWGMISDKFGRKVGFMGCAIFTSIFGFGSSWSPNFWYLLSFRCLVGFGLGGAPVAFSLFAEFLPTKNRGIPLTLFEFFWTIGTIGEAGLAWLVLPSLGWRWLLGISTIPIAILLLFYPFLPESPRYLLVSGKYDKAVEQLEKLAKANNKKLPPGKLFAGDTKKPTARVSDLFAPSLRRTTLLLWVIWFCNTFVYYGLVLFTPGFFQTEAEEDSETQNTVYLEVLITSAAEIPGLITAAFLIDRLGRKYTSGLMFLLCGLSILGLIPQFHDILSLVLAMLGRMFITGTFSTAYVYTPEVYPTTIRTTGLGTASAVARIAGILTPYVSNVLSTYELYIPIIVYASTAFIASLASVLLPLETKSRAMPDAVITKVNNTLVAEREDAPLLRHAE